MDSTFSGYILDIAKCQNLGLWEKREIVWQLSKWPNIAPKKLQAWSRKDLLEILCTEMGKERKYTGLTKQKIIENLFKIVSEKSRKHVEGTFSTPHSSTAEPQTPAKRQRKNDHPLRLPTAENIFEGKDEAVLPKNTRFCLNVACRATLSEEDLFCRRCSCCICCKYDDNKDPSLWLFCSSEDPNQGESCGLSCHLHCALTEERIGLEKNREYPQLDGSYCCTHCGKINSLVGCWRKQLIVAKDARRVDVLCHRVLLSHKIVSGTHKYQKVHKIVEEALKKLESEVGPLNGCNSQPNMGRGIVNRLSVGAEVQRLCAQAIEVLDIMSSTLSSNAQLQKANLDPFRFIKFEERSSFSVVLVLNFEEVQSYLSEELLGCTIWHRKVDGVGYLAEPTGTLYKPSRRFIIAELFPSTEYVFKIVAFSERRELENWEVGVTTSDLLSEDVISKPVAEETSAKTNRSGLSNPSPEGIEPRNNGIYTDLNNSPDSYFSYREKPEVMDSEKLSDQIYSCKEINEETEGLSESALDEEPNSTLNTDSNQDSNSTEQNQPIDASKLENVLEMVAVPLVPVSAYRPVAEPVNFSFSLPLENALPKPERESGSSSKRCEQYEELGKKDGPMEGDYEYCVKVIRWLECKGLIESNFRVKFLTWYSLRANSQEKRILSAYVDTLIDDPRSLAGQVVDTFSDAIFSKRSPPLPTGFCTRLWH